MTVSTFTFQSAPDISSSAAFRKWAQGIHDSFITCGWVQTSDTGQLDIGSATVPGTADTPSGYLMYRLDDDLQGAAPVFVKFEPGRGSHASSNVPSSWFTVGQATDGAGTLSDIILPRTQAASGSSTTGSTTEYPSYASGDGASLCLAMWPMSATNPIFMFIIERSRNADGEPTGEGFLIGVGVAAGGQGGGGVLSNVVRTIGNGGSAASMCAQDNFLNARFPSVVNNTTLDLGGSLSRDGVVAPVFPIPCVAPGVTPWVSNIVTAVHPADAGATSVIQAATINGQTRIYRAFPVWGSSGAAQHRGLIAVGSRSAYPAILWAEEE
jgi:hypothetical protein